MQIFEWASFRRDSYKACWCLTPLLRWLLLKPVKNVVIFDLRLFNPIGIAFTSCLTCDTWKKLVSKPPNISFDGKLEAIVIREKASASLGRLRQTNISQASWALKVFIQLYFQIIFISSSISSRGCIGRLRGFPTLHYF